MVMFKKEEIILNVLKIEKYNISYIKNIIKKRTLIKHVIN